MIGGLKNFALVLVNEFPRAKEIYSKQCDKGIYSGAPVSGYERRRDMRFLSSQSNALMRYLVDACDKYIRLDNSKEDIEVELKKFVDYCLGLSKALDFTIVEINKIVLDGYNSQRHYLRIAKKEIYELFDNAKASVVNCGNLISMIESLISVCEIADRLGFCLAK